MNKAYEAMRTFWMDAESLRHKKDVPLLGEEKICIAGVEMAAVDAQGNLKHLLIAASSLGNASVYFENNSPSGLGGFTGGSAAGPVQQKARLLLEAAAAAHLPEADTVSAPQDPADITLFAVSGQNKRYAQTLKEAQARDPKHPLYPFFAYTQQLLGSFREQTAAAAAPAAEPSANPEPAKQD